MANAKLSLKVAKKDFEHCITQLDIKMSMLDSVIDRYNNAKKSLENFIDSTDSNYENMLRQIEEYVKNAKRAYTALKETKAELQSTVDKMENIGVEIKQTIDDATEAAKSALEAAIKVNSIL